MKICHVITRMIVGGAQENTLFTVKGHIENGHETVLVTGPTTGPEGKLLQGQKIQNLHIELVDALTREVAITKDIVAYQHLRRYFAEEKFDVVHTHSSKAGILGRLAARRAGVPVVVHTVHGQAFHAYQAEWKNRMYIRAERYAAKHCDRIYAVADAMVEQCVEAGVAPRTKYRTVYSGMDLKPYLNLLRDAELAESLGLPPGVPVIGKIARLFELKGHEFLIPAAKEVIDEMGDVRFLLVGDGLWRDKIQKMIQSAGLMKYFVFAGLVAPEEIPRYISVMDVLVHLSLREGLPRTVIQALASARPAVGYNLDGTPEAIIDGKTGFICPPESTLAVAAAIIKLLKKPERTKEMGKAGREFVREKWDWRYMVAQLEADYLALLKEKGIDADPGKLVEPEPKDEEREEQPVSQESK